MYLSYKLFLFGIRELLRDDSLVLTRSFPLVEAIGFKSLA